MFSRLITATLTASLLALAMSGCATEGSSEQMSSTSSSPSASATKTTDHAEFSGFLSDYSQLKPAPGLKNVLEWINPEPWKPGYNAIIIEQVVTHLDPALIKSGVNPDPEVLNKITDYYHQALVREFSKYFTVTDTAGNGVMRYRAAITGVDAERDMGDNPLDYIPVVLVTRTVSGANSVKAHIFMEAIYTDSVNGQVLAEIVQSATGGDSAKEISLGSVRSALDAWAKQAAEGTKAAIDKRSASTS